MTRTRCLETHEVKTLTYSTDGKWGTILTTDGTGFMQPLAVAARLSPGTAFSLETVNYSTITGILLGTEWLLHKTDDDLAAEHAAFVADLHQKDEERLERSRTNWAAREAALPEWGRKRLERFHQTGGAAFDLQGWGYELTVAELAALYLTTNNEDTDEINAYAADHGTSGNQHACAKTLATLIAGGATGRAQNLPAALTPLTGDHDYSDALARMNSALADASTALRNLGTTAQSATALAEAVNATTEGEAR